MADFTVEGIITVDSSKAIKNITRFQNKLKSAKKDVDALDKAITKLNKRNVNIDVDVDKSSIDDFNKAAQNIDDIKVDTDLDSVADDAERIRREIDSISGADIEVALDADRALNEARETRREVDAALGSADIKVRADYSQLSGMLSAIQANTAALGAPGRGGLIGGVALLATTLLPLASAATGVAGGMVASFGVMGTAVGSFIGFAIPGIKEVAEAIKLLNANTEDMSPDELAEYNEQLRDMKKNNPAVWEAAQGFKILKKNYLEFANSLKPDILEATVHALRTANTLIGYMGPIAQATAPAITDLFKSMNRNLSESGGEWERFFGYVERNAADFVGIWGRTVGNFITGIANMIVAFDPLTQMVNDGFLSMSESFRNWSRTLEDNKAFQDFVAYVLEKGPQVWDTLGDLFDLLIDMGVALAPIGERILDMITRFGNWYERMQELNPELVNTVTQVGFLAAVLAPFAGLLAPIIGPLKGLASGLAAVAGISGGTAGAIAAVAGAMGLILAVLPFLKQDTSTYKQMIDDLKSAWERLKEVGKEVKDIFVEFYETLERSGAIEMMQVNVSKLANAFEKLMPVLKPVAYIFGAVLLGSILASVFVFSVLAEMVSRVADYFDRLKTQVENLPENFERAKNEIIAIFARLYARVVEIVGKIVNGIVNFFARLYGILLGSSIIPDIVNGIVNWFAKLPGKLRNLVSRAVNAVINGFKRMWKKAVKVAGNLVNGVVTRINKMANKVKNLAGRMKDWVVRQFNRLKDGATRAINRAKDAVVRTFSRITSTARNKVSAMANAVRNGFGRAKDAAVRLAGRLKDGAVRQFNNVVSRARSVLSRVKGAVTGAFSGAGSWLVSAGSRLMSGLASGVRSAGQRAIDAARSVASTIAGLLPGSPIKFGPLKSWNQGGAGKRLMGLLAQGIDSDRTVLNAMTRQANAMSMKQLVGGGAGSGLNTGPLSGGGGNTYNINVSVPLGASKAEVGREIVNAISEYEEIGGKKR